MLSRVSPKTADPALRTALLDAAADLIAEHGSGGLSLRRLASEVGTSTMAIYTHFGGMDEVRRAVRREGFARLAAHLATVERSGDPVADLSTLGWAYYVNAMTNPNLYRAMFMERPLDATDADVGVESFLLLVDCVDSCRRAGRFEDADPVERTTQLWAIEHGVISAHLTGIPPLLTTDQVIDTISAASANLFKAFGDDPRSAGRSIATARRRAGIDTAGTAIATRVI
jgi:AcrR family transcriptional regulator